MKPEPPSLRTISPPVIAGEKAVPAAVGWRSPALLLMLMAAAMQLSFASWSALQYNFAYEMLSFSGREIGIQQSIREIPGFPRKYIVTIRRQFYYNECHNVSYVLTTD